MQMWARFAGHGTEQVDILAACFSSPSVLVVRGGLMMIPCLLAISHFASVSTSHSCFSPPVYFSYGSGGRFTADGVACKSVV